MKKTTERTLRRIQLGFKKILSPGENKDQKYAPQREHIDRRHDALQRQMSYYEKKRQIPQMQARIKQYEREIYGSGFRTPNSNSILHARNVFQPTGDNILKTPNHFGRDPNGTILNVPDMFNQRGNNILSQRSGYNRQSQRRFNSAQNPQHSKESMSEKMARLRAMRGKKR